jgi:hypothetical protein
MYTDAVRGKSGLLLFYDSHFAEKEAKEKTNKQVKQSRYTPWRHLGGEEI